MARSTSRTALQPAHKMTQLAACVALALASANVLAQAPATVTATASTTAADANKVETVIVTGSRIKAAALTATSPVSQFSAEDIALVRAVTVEDFSVKLPQLAGG